MPSLLEVHRKSLKPRDLFMNTWVYRPLATPLVVLLAPTRVTPNQVTLASLVVAWVAAALLVFAPGYLGLLLAVGTYCFSYILDCVDGMLARYRGVASPQGHLFDFLMDEIKSFFILGGACVRLYREAGERGEAAPERYLLLGIGGLVVLATGIALTTFQRRPEIAGPSASPAPSSAAPLPPTRSLARRALGAAESVAKLAIHYPSYIPFVALVGRLELYVLPYTAVLSLYALKMLAWAALRFGRSVPLDTSSGSAGAT
jgi:hypothetical protein